ncbi:MAG: diphthine synthase [Crenarchaeota archaeon]|nr:diphthine synthase [Thermoproteota archaeon]
MATLYIVGAGVYPDYISLRGVEILRKVARAFCELYTSPISLETLLKVLRNYVEDIDGKIEIISRREIEDESCRRIIEELKKGNDVALLVPGDPMFATTHSAIRIIVRKSGFNCEIVHGVSILNAAVSLLGLSPYRFGPVATVVYPRMGVLPERAYDVVLHNLRNNLHTLLLLDIRDDGGFMTAEEALNILSELEHRRREGLFVNDRVIIVLERVGFPDQKVHVATFEEARERRYGAPPHSIVVPSRLSPVEQDLLHVEFGVSYEILEKAGLLL